MKVNVDNLMKIIENSKPPGPPPNANGPTPPPMDMAKLKTTITKCVTDLKGIFF